MVVVNPRGPPHCATCSGSVQASQTRSRGASNTRVITISRPEMSSLGMLFPLAMSRLLFFLLAQIIAQAIESALPNVTILFLPVGNIPQVDRFAGPELPLRFP